MILLFNKKDEYQGPVDQYGRPLGIKEDLKKTEDDRKLLKRLFTIVGVVTVVIVIALLIFNYISNTRLEIPKASLSTTDWTNKSVIVTVEKRGSAEEFSFDGGKTWQTNNKLEVFENQELKLQVKNSFGDVSKEVTVVISNIDKENPEVYFVDPYYMSVGSSFDAKANVYSTDNASGIASYTVDVNSLDLSTPGEYNVTYYVKDLVGNEVIKTRRIIVEELGKTYQYRSRSRELVDSECEEECNCLLVSDGICPSDTSVSSEDSTKCCTTCMNPCQVFKYGEWSEWTTKKLIPSSSLEVEMKSE